MKTGSKQFHFCLKELAFLIFWGALATAWGQVDPSSMNSPLTSTVTPPLDTFSQSPSDTTPTTQHAKNPVEITADGNTHFENGVAVAEDNVQIRYNGVTIYCDKAEYNSETRDVLLIGNVRIYDKKNLMAAQRALYNLETKQLRGLQFEGDMIPLKFRALSMRSVSQDEFHTKASVLTTSDSSIPTWGIHAHTMRIYNKDRVIFLNSVVYAGKVPIFWVPYMYASLKETGIQILPGYDSTWGGYLLTSYGSPIGKGDHLMARIHSDYRSLRGYALGLDLDDRFGKDNRNTGHFQAYYAWDHNPNINNAPGQQTIATPLNNDYVGRYRVTFDQKFYLKDDLYATADINKLSDFTFMQTYYPTENSVNPQPDNNITLTQKSDDATLSLVTRWQMNNFQETTERLPELAADFKQTPLFDLPLYYDGTTAVGQLQRSFAVNTTNNPNYFSPSQYNATRFDTFHQISIPEKFFGWLSFIPKIGMRITAYDHGGGYTTTNGATTTFATTTTNGITQPNNLNWGGAITRPIFNAGLETSFKVSRNFEWMQSRLLGLDGVRHVFQPYSNLSYVYAGGPSANQVFQFDRYMPNNPSNPTRSGFQTSSPELQPLNFPEFAAIDTIDTWAIMRVGARNRLQTRRNGDTYDWFYLDTFTDINGINPYINGPVSNLNNQFTFRPVSWFSFLFDTQVPITPEGFTEVNFAFNIMPARWFQFSIRSAYIDNYNGMSGNQPSLTEQWKLTDHWSISASQIFNMGSSSTTTGTTSSTANSILDQRYLINRDLSSWIISLGAEVRNNQGITTSTTSQNALLQYSAVIAVTLKDAPNIMLQNAFAAPNSNTPQGGTLPLVPMPSY